MWKSSTKPTRGRHGPVTGSIRKALSQTHSILTIVLVVTVKNWYGSKSTECLLSFTLAQQLRDKLEVLVVIVTHNLISIKAENW